MLSELETDIRVNQLVFKLGQNLLLANPVIKNINFMKIYIVILILCSNLLFAQAKKQALSDFLQTKISDYNQEIFIVKEKTSINHVIDVFKGKTYKDSVTNHYDRDEREEIKKPLYNENDWVKMKKKYYNDSEKTNSKAEMFWNSNDFNYNNIHFFSIHSYIEFIISHSENRRPTTPIFSFSEPIYYHCKKYLVFKVAEGNTESINGLTDNYLIMMKKENKKWIVVNKSYQLDIFY
jgi:hypothetical protein